MLTCNATLVDIPDIQAINAHHVLHGTCTSDETPSSVEDMIANFHTVIGLGRTWSVAVDVTSVHDHAYFVQFRDRSAYQFTARGHYQRA